MTEFILENENGVSNRQFDLCIKDGTQSTCNGDWISMSNTCGTVTDNGDFILVNDSGYMFKLGKCGLEKIQGLQLTNASSGMICGNIPGGALYCAGKVCYKYNDVNQSLEALPDLNDYHSEGNVAYSNGQVRVIGGTMSDPDNYMIEILALDESEWVGASFWGGDDFPEREFKGFEMVVVDETDMYTFKGYGIVNSTYGEVNDYIITTYFNWLGEAQLNAGWYDIGASPIMDWEYPSTLYDNFVSHMFQDRMIHAQPVFCSDPDPTQSGKRPDKRNQNYSRIYC